MHVEMSFHCVCNFQTNKYALKIQKHVIFIAKITQFQPEKANVKGIACIYYIAPVDIHYVFSAKVTYRKCIGSLIHIFMSIFYLFFPKLRKNNLNNLAHDNRYFS